MSSSGPTHHGERHPGESDELYAYFVAYRDLGPDRTLALAATRVERAEITLREYSAKFHWVRRALEWDEYLDRQAREAAVEATREKRAKLATEMADWALEVTNLARGRARLDAREMKAALDAIAAGGDASDVDFTTRDASGAMNVAARILASLSEDERAAAELAADDPVGLPEGMTAVEHVRARLRALAPGDAGDDSEAAEQTA